MPDTAPQADISPRAGAARLPDALVTAALALGAVVSVAGFLLAFLWAPPVSGASVSEPRLIADTMVTTQLLISQKIFYIHMPVAIVSFCMLIAACVWSVRFLMTRQMRFDTLARVSMEVALLFVIATMATGEMWTRFEWGVWWTWEPRLTTYLVLMLIVIAYFVLRASIDSPDRRGASGAVVAILATIDVPICFAVTRLIPSSLHPVVLREGGMTFEMAVTVCVCLVGAALIGLVIWHVRLRQVRLAERTEEISRRLDPEED